MKNKYLAGIIMVCVAMLGIVTNVAASESMRFASSVDRISYEKSGQFEIGPFIGYHQFENKQNLEDSFSYGGRLGYNFSSHLGAEITLGVVKADVKNKALVGLAKGQYRSPTNSVDVKYYQVDAIYQFKPARRFSPFVTAGIGRSLYSPEVLNNDTNTFNLGVGAKYWIKKDIAIRADIRAFEEKSFRNYSGTVEVAYAFGSSYKNKKVEVAQPVVEPKPEPMEIAAIPEAPWVEEDAQKIEYKQKTIILEFEDVHFNFDKSTLTNAAKVILQRSIRLLHENPDTRIRIIGYTSASGTSAYNQRLSERRANTVTKYLIGEGMINPDRLTTIGYGQSNPAEYEAFPKQKHSVAALANMRVSFETILTN